MGYAGTLAAGGYMCIPNLGYPTCRLQAGATISSATVLYVLSTFSHAFKHIGSEVYIVAARTVIPAFQ